MTVAHAAHWYHSLLYLLPVLLIAAALWWSGRDGADGDAQDGEDDLLELDGPEDGSAP